MWLMSEWLTWDGKLLKAFFEWFFMSFLKALTKLFISSFLELFWPFKSFQIYNILKALWNHQKLLKILNNFRTTRNIPCSIQIDSRHQLIVQQIISNFQCFHVSSFVQKRKEKRRRKIGKESNKFEFLKNSLKAFRELKLYPKLLPIILNVQNVP